MKYTQTNLDKLGDILGESEYVVRYERGTFQSGWCLLEAKKIAAMAEVDHVQIAPHLYCGPIVGAANIQIATCSPNFLILESIESWGGFHTEILKSPIRFEEGHVIPSTEPGLGVELNEDVARANPYTGNMLHLEMTQHPVQ